MAFYLCTNTTVMVGIREFKDALVGAIKYPDGKHKISYQDASVTVEIDGNQVQICVDQATGAFENIAFCQDRDPLTLTECRRRGWQKVIVKAEVVGDGHEDIFCFRNDPDHISRRFGWMASEPDVFIMDRLLWGLSRA